LGPGYRNRVGILRYRSGISGCYREASIGNGRVDRAVPQAIIVEIYMIQLGWHTRTAGAARNGGPVGRIIPVGGPCCNPKAIRGMCSSDENLQKAKKE
jgi:hypothetical protein